MRPATLLAWCRRRGIEPPAATPEALHAWFEANAMAGSLERYLEGFGLTVAAMADLDALAQVAFEAAEDARAEGCVLAEFRVAPVLWEMPPFGLAGEAVMEALLAGLSRSALPCGLIVCALRHHEAPWVARSAELALRHRWGGPQHTAGEAAVVGFDLAGPEAGFPATQHAAVLQRLNAGGLPLTLHAGEADEALRVVEAVDLGARRIGHGVRLADVIGTPQEALLQRVKAAGVHLEVCPTSNVQTGAAASIERHPIRALWDAGVSLSFHPDNRLISVVDQSLEAARLVEHAGFRWEDLRRMGQLAAAASFLPDTLRQPALAALAAWQPPVT